VLGNALGPAAQASFMRGLSIGGANAEGAIKETMAKAAEIAARFPRLRERLGTAATEYAASPEHTFEFGLEAILDGLEGRLPSGRRNSPRRRSREPSRVSTP
jgi:hypothetical protein